MIKELTTQEIYACSGGVRLQRYTLGRAEAIGMACIALFFSSISLIPLIRPTTNLEWIITIAPISVLTIMAYKHSVGLEMERDLDARD